MAMQQKIRGASERESSDRSPEAKLEQSGENNASASTSTITTKNGAAPKPRKEGLSEWQSPKHRGKRQRHRDSLSISTPKAKAKARGVTVVHIVDVRVRIPKHSSVLSQPCVRKRRLCQESESSFRFSDSTIHESHRCDGSSKSEPKSNGINPSLWPSALNLELRCYHPGVLWRGLLPMIFAPSDHLNGNAKSQNGRSDSIHYRDHKRNENAPFPSERAESEDSSSSLRTETPNSNPCTKATIATLPQRTLLGLGLEDAVTRYHHTMVDQVSSEVQTRGDPTEEESTDENRTSEELFYERIVKVPLDLLPRSKCKNKGDGNGDGDGDGDGNNLANSSSSSKVSVIVWIFPPLMPPSDMDKTPFAAIVLKTQTMASIRNGCSAWFYTLGGGYFGIKSLKKSLWFSKQQRNLAEWLGDIKMVRQCTLNEAYNWMYSGQFRKAESVLDNLEADVANSRRKTWAMDGSDSRNRNSKKPCSYSNYTVDDERILQRCSAARVCLRRMETLSQQGLEKYPADHETTNTTSTPASTLASRTHDDFQRMRIVSMSD